MSTTWVAMPSVSSSLAAWMPSQVAGSLMSTLSWLTPFALNSASRLWARSRSAAAGQRIPGQPVELGRLLGAQTHTMSGQAHRRCAASQHTAFVRYSKPVKGTIAQAGIHRAGHIATAKLMAEELTNTVAAERHPPPLLHM